MATATAPKPRKARRPAPTRCRLTLTIGSTAYTVRPIASDLHSRAYRLRKPDGTAYHVTQDIYGHHCDCGDFIWRHEGNVTSCKHIKSLIVCRLLDVTSTALTVATSARVHDEPDSP